jgi:chromosome segregation ATPase
MIFKGMKFAAAGVAGVGLLGALIFGREMASYVRCSAKSVRTAVRDTVPVEFELQRARDMVEGIIPELQANIRLIAEEEVEIAALKKDIDQSESRLAGAKEQIADLRDTLAVQQVATRERSLEAARQMLERARERKSHLEQQIEALVAQHRLLKAESVGTQLQIDGSQLAKAEKLIGQITKRLDVAERVLRHESDLMPILGDEPVSEADLIEEVDEYFTRSGNETAAKTPDA